MVIVVLATGMNTCFLDRLQKHRRQLALSCSGMQLAKQLDSQDIAQVIATEIADSFWLLAITHLAKEMASELSFFAS